MMIVHHASCRDNQGCNVASAAISDVPVGNKQSPPRKELFEIKVETDPLGRECDLSKDALPRHYGIIFPPWTGFHCSSILLEKEQ